jgi:hypothetical protein
VAFLLRLQIQTRDNALPALTTTIRLSAGITLK